jgi:cytochrome c oxidase subunit 2
MKRALALGFVLAAGFISPPGPPARAEEPRIVTIAAKRFEFTPASITLKRGEPVRLLVTSEDVTHGFFQRVLKIDTDLMPGKTEKITVTPQEAGTFTIICHHFCGAQHANMRMTVVVE